MTNYRRFSGELTENGEQLRYQLLWILSDFNISTANTLIEKEVSMTILLNALNSESADSTDEPFVNNYRYLIETVFHLIKWCAGALSAKPGSEAELTAAKLKIELFDMDGYNYTDQFKKQLTDYKNAVLALQKVNEVKANFDMLRSIAWPYLLSVEKDEYGFRKRASRVPATVEEDEPEKSILIVALELFIDKEPWANPQILKPQLVYTVNCKVKISKWPDKAVKLYFQPVSTQQSTFYELILPEVSNNGQTEFEVTGKVLFKYPQHSFDESYGIKLLAYYVDADVLRIFPELIGYNQLIAKVFDPNSSFFLTGFPNMNELVLSVFTDLQKELPSVNTDEQNNFLKLLSGVLNFQGYCLQAGTYKGKTDIAEDTFRDNMLQYLNSLNYLGADVIKEPQVAGGRIEIYYKGLIAELKVEKTISDRNQLIKKYGKQPVAYASGNAKQLSMLVILDLTEKKLPPAAPQNNMKLITPKLHGFEDAEPPFPSKQVVVIFDGNTKKPSDYSR